MAHVNSQLNCYLKELDRIEFSDKYGAQVKFRADGKDSKWLGVNKDSAAAILIKLIDVLGMDTLTTALENLRDGITARTDDNPADNPRCTCGSGYNPECEGHDNPEKYEFTGKTKVVKGVTLRRIRALRDFGAVKAWDLGGWLEKEENLSHEGAAWVFGDALVFGNAQISEDARVSGNARVFGDARVCGNAWVCDDVWVYCSAWVCGDAHISDNARVFGDARVSGDARVYGSAQVFDDARVFDKARVFGDAWVRGDARVTD